MKTVGMVVEYNPFHNGHLYHLEESKRLSGADAVVCVMSGNFIQRGEPALINKWARAKAALLSGADLILELPSVYAMSSAEYFASGAVKILDATGAVDYMCFGSESGNIEEFNIPSEILLNEPELYKIMLKEELSKGKSYPYARERALSRYIGGPQDVWESLMSMVDEPQGIRKSLSSVMDEPQVVRERLPSIMNQSNNILGIEYMKALKKLKSKIIPLTLKRIGNEYNSDRMTGVISSATAIRKSILCSRTDINTYKVPEQAMPALAYSVIKEEFEAGRGPVSFNDFESIILSAVRKMSAEQIKTLPYVGEGLENRIKAASDKSGSLSELIDAVCTKRYPRTRIQRILCSILTGITSLESDTFIRYGGPQYIRVLGFNKTGRSILSQMKNKSTLPVIVKTSDFKNSCNPLLRRMLEIEAASADMYVLAYKNPAFRKPGQEFTQNIVIL